MVEIRRVVACAECGLYWDGGSEPARCRNGNHEHRVLEVHRHLDTVVLSDGTRLTAASFDPVGPYVRSRVPDYGLYLDPRCAKAVETPGQEAFVAALFGS